MPVRALAGRWPGCPGVRADERWWSAARRTAPRASDPCCTSTEGSALAQPYLSREDQGLTLDTRAGKGKTHAGKSSAPVQGPTDRPWASLVRSVSARTGSGQDPSARGHGPEGRAGVSPFGWPAGSRKASPWAPIPSAPPSVPTHGSSSTPPKAPPATRSPRGVRHRRPFRAPLPCRPTPGPWHQPSCCSRRVTPGGRVAPARTTVPLQPWITRAFVAPSGPGRT
ncbi:hypothetical protein SAMN05216466_106202 [Paraburkholderia phenazinium]|uniref:Uncharacterized protein n=1 Tax=Paraburkholderia phenazinium TaxID=60549 RepID=A0A1G7YJ25_9BURK|nr:hypothetical protein SAMN05216466_106202 [Paraburkholderia phenazinium]